MECPECGQLNAESHNFCFECGASLKEMTNESRLVRALGCEGEGQPNQAEQELHEILHHSPDFAPARQFLADLHFMKGEFQKSIEMCESLLSQQPHNCLARFRKATALFYQGHVSESVVHLRQVIKRHPRFCFAYYYLGLSYMHLGKWRLAASALTQACHMMPENHEVHYLLGLVHERRRQLQPAITEFKHVLAKNPSDSEAKIHLKQLIKLRGQEESLDESEREAMRFVDAELLNEVHQEVWKDREMPYE